MFKDQRVDELIKVVNEQSEIIKKQQQEIDGINKTLKVMDDEIHPMVMGGKK